MKILNNFNQELIHAFHYVKINRIKSLFLKPHRYSLKNRLFLKMDRHLTKFEREMKEFKYWSKRDPDMQRKIQLQEQNIELRRKLMCRVNICYEEKIDEIEKEYLERKKNILSTDIQAIKQNELDLFEKSKTAYEEKWEDICKMPDELLIDSEKTYKYTRVRPPWWDSVPPCPILPLVNLVNLFPPSGDKKEGLD